MRKTAAQAADLRKTFGNAVRHRRKSLGISQRVMASEYGLSQRLLSSIETGSNNCTIRTMARIAEALEADLSAMLTATKPVTAE